MSFFLTTRSQVCIFSAWVFWKQLQKYPHRYSMSQSIWEPKIYPKMMALWTQVSDLVRYLKTFWAWTSENDGFWSIGIQMATSLISGEGQGAMDARIPKGKLKNPLTPSCWFDRIGFYWKSHPQADRIFLCFFFYCQYHTSLLLFIGRFLGFQQHRAISSIVWSAIKHAINRGFISCDLAWFHATPLDSKPVGSGSKTTDRWRSPLSASHGWEVPKLNPGCLLLGKSSMIFRSCWEKEASLDSLQWWI